MTYVFNEHGKLIGLAFHDAINAPAVRFVYVFDDKGRCIGRAFA